MNDQIEIVKKIKNVINSLLFLSMLVSLGILFDLLKFIPKCHFPSYPLNVYFLLALTFLSLFVYIKYHKSDFIGWIIGTSATITTVIILLSLIILAEIIRSYPTFIKIPVAINSANLQSSWTLLFIKLYLYVCLCFAIFKRSVPFVINNIGFLLNHIGILLVIAGFTFGRSDIQSLTVNLLEKGEKNNIGITANKQLKTIPFNIQLLNFTLVTTSNYWSELILTPDTVHNDTVILGKDKPYRYKRWKLYQESYDISKGKLSSLSRIKAIYDPWQKVIYAGFILLIFGGLILIRTQKKNQKNLYYNRFIYIIYLIFLLLTTSIILSYILLNEASGIFWFWNLNNEWLQATWLLLFILIHFNFYFKHKTTVEK